MEVLHWIMHWKEYVAELYHGDRPDVTEIKFDNNDSPTVMIKENRVGSEDMKVGKAVGGDGEASELLQTLINFAIDQFTLLFR